MNGSVKLELAARGYLSKEWTRRRDSCNILEGNVLCRVQKITCTGLGERAGPRLRKLASCGQRRNSRNLGPTLLLSPVHFHSLRFEVGLSVEIPAVKSRYTTE